MKRVVITGMGIVCPVGTGIDYTWKNILNGKARFFFVFFDF